MLPTFLGIGAPKAGTTWLYQLLDGHPDIAMSRHRKEVHFFDHHFDRGAAWYERFFPDDPGHSRIAVGEYTTHYLYDPAVPARVRTYPSIDRFVLIVRNPVDRALSHYRFRRRQDNHDLTFEQFVDREPGVLGLGLYGRNLERWLAEFGAEQFLVLVFEQAVGDPQDTRRRLAEHLGVDPARFPPAVPGAANESFTPRRRGLYATAVRQARWLRRHDLDRLIAASKRTGVVRALQRSRSGPAPDPVTAEQRERLWDAFATDVALLEVLAGLDLDSWRPPR